ncbi:MAG: hypothetical protein CMJ83_02390 [Planctomycetes bacterium]|jgi:hypothetical protein|nr:hypothetical protein [Planctomycetota bacterium]
MALMVGVVHRRVGQSLGVAGSLLTRSGLYRAGSQGCIASTVKEVSGPLEEICDQGLLSPHVAFEAGFGQIFERCRSEF